jgi:hypothetical protein
MRECVLLRLKKKGIYKKNTLEEYYPFESHFLWNHYLVKEFYEILIKKKWVMPVIYGDIS